MKRNSTKLLLQCFDCKKISAYRANTADGKGCAHCGSMRAVPLPFATPMPAPTESAEQQALFQWAQWSAGKYSGLDLMYHIPNGGARSKSEAGRFKAEGVKAGVPDIFLPVARGSYHGLYIEMKRRGGKVSGAQQGMLDRLRAQGYCAVVCYGFEAARVVIEEYYNLGVMK